jgi:hypothetical protein
MCGPIRIVVKEWVEQKGSGFYSQTMRVGDDLDRSAQTFRTWGKNFPKSARGDARTNCAHHPDNFVNCRG